MADIRRIGERVEQFGEAHGLPPALIFHLNLALDELVSNFFNHGVDPRSVSSVLSIRLTLGANGLTTELTDNGIPFDPRVIPPPDPNTPVEEKPIGGLVPHLVGNVVDEFDYRRENDVNHLIPHQKMRIGDSRSPS